MCCGKTNMKRIDLIVTEFPIINTNVCDAFWAIPAILLGIFLLKVVFKLPESWFSTATTIMGLTMTIFHRFFYGCVANGAIYSMKV